MNSPRLIHARIPISLKAHSNTLHSDLFIKDHVDILFSCHWNQMPGRKQCVGKKIYVGSCLKKSLSITMRRKAEQATAIGTWALGSSYICWTKRQRKEILASSFFSCMSPQTVGQQSLGFGDVFLITVKDITEIQRAVSQVILDPFKLTVKDNRHKSTQTYHL